MKKVLALIAHDSKKDDVVQLIKAHKEELADIDMIATLDTGQRIRERTGRPVTLLLSGQMGGEQQIGALLATGQVTAVFFLRDPLNARSHEPDFSGLLKICDVHNIPIATNLVAAEAILHLMAEHPEALSGQHLAAQYLAEMADQHE
jgi:methylglyoxal synthase